MIMDEESARLHTMQWIEAERNLAILGIPLLHRPNYPNIPATRNDEIDLPWIPAKPNPINPS